MTPNYIDEDRHDPTHSFSVNDARTMGVEKAILYKEILRMSLYKYRNGKNPYVYYSSRALAEKFPYMASKSIARWLNELENDGYLLTKIENKHLYDRTKSYCPTWIITDVPEQPAKNEKLIAQNEESTAQNEETIPPLSYSLDSTASAGIHYESEENTKPISGGSKKRGYDNMVKWAEIQRGFKFLSGTLTKQYKAFTIAKANNLTGKQLKERWLELENDAFWSSKGFDWMDVVVSFNKKPPEE